MTFDEVLAALNEPHDYPPLFTVAGRLGVAHRVIGVTPQFIAVRAVGDDYTHQADPSELTLITGDVCSCGQVGCEWH
jgi:hypothetical protein